MEKHERRANHFYRPNYQGGAAVGAEKQMDELTTPARNHRQKLSHLLKVLDFSETGSVFEMLRRDGITGRVVVKIPQ
jgi:hypothetical protein